MTDGEFLYKLIEKVMADTFGPTGRASNVTWEKMDGPPEAQNHPDFRSEKAAWEKIAKRFYEEKTWGV
jgi:hypothetical protein